MSSLSPEKAEEAIQFYLHQLGELVNQYSKAADAKAETEAAYRLAWAKSRVEYRQKAAEEGWRATEAIVDDQATLSTHEELKARLSAAAVEESTKLALRACSSKLDGARSLAANLRSVT